MEAKLIGKIDISKAGGGKGLLGDIDGDGRMELVIVQADSGIDDRYVPHQITCVTAYRLSGELMWQVGDASGRPGNFGSDFPAQIYDIDCDGQLEILCVMKKRFLVLEGSTGRIKKDYPLPGENAHDCIIIANLSGGEHAKEILLKDRYTHMWAMSNDFEVLWTHEGNLGHFPWAYDVDGDGYDEVMAGYDLLDHTGKLRWSCKNLEDHADCLWVGDVNGDGKLEIAVGGSVTCLYSIEGEELWRYEGSIESQHVALGRFLPEEKGLQVAGLDRIRRGDGHKGQWDGRDGMFLLDCEGREVWKEDRKTKGWLTIVDALSNWNGDGRDYILAYRRGGGENPALYNGKMEKEVTFSQDGYVLHGDLLGRGREDVIVYNGQTAWIFSGTEYDWNTPPSGKPIPQTKRLYSSTLYPGGCVPLASPENRVQTGKEPLQPEESFQKIRQRKKRIFLAGDSTMQSYGASAAPQTGWGQVWHQFLKGDEDCKIYHSPDSAFSQAMSYELEKVVIDNRAMAGRSSRSFREEGRLADIGAVLGEGDYLFAQFAHNDANKGKPERYVPAEAFGDSLYPYLELCRSRKATLVLVTAIAMRNCEESADGIFQISFPEYREAMIRFAREQNVILLDMGKATTEYCQEIGGEACKKLFLWTEPGEYPDSSHRGGTKDNAHLQKEGAVAFAGILTRLVREYEEDGRLDEIKSLLASR